MILGPKKTKYVTASTFSLSFCHEVMGLDTVIYLWFVLCFFVCLFLLCQLFHSLLSPLSRGSLFPFHFLSIEHLVSQSVSSVAQSCLTLCDPMNCSTPGLPVHHQLLEFTQTHIHWVSDAIQPSHPLSSLSPPTPNPSQHHSLFQWVNSSHEVAKVLELQLQQQSFQWIFWFKFICL